MYHWYMQYDELRSTAGGHDARLCGQLKVDQHMTQTARQAASHSNHTRNDTESSPFARGGKAPMHTAKVWARHDSQTCSNAECCEACLSAAI